MSDSTTDSGKVKRKDPHPVRREFVATSSSQYKCMYCNWTTIMNATRMVKHIVDQCESSPEQVRVKLRAIQQATLEKELNSSFASENKKDIHKLFNEDDNKRVCMFCQWSTVRNLTRMRNHILQQCTKVPRHVRSCFLKQEYDASEPTIELKKENSSSLETYRLVTAEDDGSLQVLESSAVDDADQEMEETYLEVQELDERNCGWCEKAVAYDSYEVEEESEVFCSTQCFRRHTESTRKKSLQTKPAVIAVEKEPTKQQRRLSSPQKVESPPAKTRKLVQVKSFLIKQENTPTRRRVSRSETPTFQEVDIDSEPESTAVPQTPAKAQTQPVREVEKANNVQLVVRAKPTPVTPVQKPPSLTNKATTKKQTEALDEGSCHSFAGGHVYPQEDVRSADHKLQWTKAVISRPAPQFEATAVVGGAFKKIKLSDYRGKYLVFFFYPLDFTFVCPTEILAFSDRVKEFKKLNTEVIAASIDSHFTHLAWINTPRKEGGLGKINIPLVSDITHSISKDYGVYLDDLGHTLRGLFIIDDRGILRQITMNDLPVGRSVDETLRLVQAFQYTDKHGEVCPAGWKPGQDTIVPNPEEKIKYFEKNH
ncbi:uncharacterized protein LOC129720939 [Wyeomyia smithii]|uniref:uncharacterized protein LOC129720939 n=1 Tax=Wyeomyia smithii TaxID=174621 RepID=UPI002467C33D|nr:uncharacterized protein LOC129720939 [Wyeomyia smithii]